MKAIEVIAVFSSNGTPRPMRLRMIKDGCFEVIQIRKVLYQIEDKQADVSYITFRCQGNLRGALKDFELLFNKSTCVWTLLKI
ncbi:hypothetical protein LPY66_04555 [Dehalobacter sp. DCM]|uniref:hypothetical protein n=1 Tax=Dehalobacter sp. DCM TaxID=2907827 RepID=UPI00308154AF|nr:hypothetical protein LPY66_04555 [Dehalobacter sp. DCM]